MTYSKEYVSSNDGESEIVLRLLDHVDRQNEITQRGLARDLGIALGLANAYLKKCVKKGLIKILDAPAKRYAYYLTPKGFAEKSRLTAEYLGQSFSLFRRARLEYSAMLENCIAQGETRLAIFGDSDLTDILLLCLPDFPVEIVGIVATEFKSSSDIALVESVADLPEFNAIVLTDLADPQATYDSLSEVVESFKILAPDFMNISRNKPQLDDDGGDS